MSRHAFDNSYYVKLYEYSRQGLNLTQMAKALNVSRVTLKKWRRNDPALKEAILKGRSGLQTTHSSGETFFEYVYERLPSHLKEVWDEMEAIEDEDNAEKRLEALLSGQGKRARQHLFCHALVSSNFNASEACRKCNMSRSTFEGWIRTDPDFADIMDSIQTMKKDFAEGALLGLVRQGDTTATIFVNRTLNRDRGYDVKTTVEHTGGMTHGLIDLDKLDLPVPVMRQILEAMRNATLPVAKDTPQLTSGQEKDES